LIPNKTVVRKKIFVLTEQRIKEKYTTRASIYHNVANIVLWVITLEEEYNRNTKKHIQDPHKDCSAHEPVNMPTQSRRPVQVEISEEIETGGRGSVPV